MIYNGDADKQDLINLADDFVNSNIATYPLDAKTRAANKTLRKIWSWIFGAYGGWQFDDANNTANLPIAQATLTTGQGDYDIPPTSLTIRGVDVLPQGSAIYQPLKEITEEEIKQRLLSEASFFTSTGTPRYYRPIGSSIKLYPAPNYTAANGIRVTFDRGSVAFASTDTTKQPGFASEFHECVAVGIGLEYARRNALQSFEFLQDDMNKFEIAIKDYYSQRYKEKFPAKVRIMDLTRDYL